MKPPNENTSSKLITTFLQFSKVRICHQGMQEWLLNNQKVASHIIGKTIIVSDIVSDRISVLVYGIGIGAEIFITETTTTFSCTYLCFLGE